MVEGRNLDGGEDWGVSLRTGTQTEGARPSVLLETFVVVTTLESPPKPTKSRYVDVVSRDPGPGWTTRGKRVLYPRTKTWTGPRPGTGIDGERPGVGTCPSGRRMGWNG